MKSDPKFLSKLQKHLDAKKLDPALTQAQLEKAFRGEVSRFVESHLKHMAEALKAIDKKIQGFISKHAHEGVAAQDAMSARFEEEISLKIEGWISDDNLLRGRFKTVWKAYSARLKTTRMAELIDEELAELDAKLAKHVAEANAYGKLWTSQMDKAGLVISDRKISYTINWFNHLTVQELKRLYKAD